jgi:hypothetical protein
MLTMRSPLVAATTLLAVVAMVAGAGARWIDRQVLSTPHWTATSSHLIADPPVRRAIARFLVDQTFAGSGIDQALAHVLPSSLAARADSGLRDAASGLSATALGTGVGQRVWRDANRQAQRELLDAVDHPQPGQRVVLNLTPLLHDVVRELLGTSVAQAIPGSGQLLQSQTAGAGKLVVLSPGALSALRDEVRLTRFLSWALFVAALALLAFGLLMSRARLLVSLSRTGYAIALAGAVVVAARYLVQFPLASLAVDSGTARAGVRGAWLIGSTQLRDTGIELFVIGAVVAAGSWVVRALSR